MKTFLCEESVLRYNKTNCFPSYLDHYLINNNFLIFLTENLPILNPCLPQRSENLRLHSSNSIEMRPHHNHLSRENATASSGTSPLASCKGVPPLGKRRIENSGAV